MDVIRRKDSDSNGLFSDNSDDDCEVAGACAQTTAVCLCENTYCEQHPLEDSSVRCVQCGKNRPVFTRYSEGYGTEEECVPSHPQGDSDADADIEDTDSRLQITGSLQRISSRKRKRQRITRQDTTESEDDGGRSHRTHRWSLRLSPHRAHSRTILEESVSQVRPLVICRCAGADVTAEGRRPFPMCCYLLILPLSMSLIVLLVALLLPLTDT